MTSSYPLSPYSALSPLWATEGPTGLSPIEGPIEGSIEGPIKSPIKGAIEGRVEGPVTAARRVRIDRLSTFVQDMKLPLAATSPLSRALQALNADRGHFHPKDGAHFLHPLSDIKAVEDRLHQCEARWERWRDASEFFLRKRVSQRLPDDALRVFRQSMKDCRQALELGDPRAADRSFDVALALLTSHGMALLTRSLIPLPPEPALDPLPPTPPVTRRGLPGALARMRLAMTAGGRALICFTPQSTARRERPCREPFDAFREPGRLSSD